MSTSPVDQVPSTSFDAQGVSVVTANKSLVDPRAGVVYNPVNFATGVPVYFHPLGDNQFLGLFSQRWYGATPSVIAPQAFTAYSVDHLPSWAILNASSGNLAPVGGQGGSFTPPMKAAYDTRVLTGACSRSTSYVYLLNAVVKGLVPSAVIQHFHVNTVGVANLLAEETIPSVTIGGNDVLFNLGVQLNTPYLIFAGSDPDGNVFLCRNNWGKIGQLAAPPKVLFGQAKAGNVWEYQTARGWSADPTSAVPLISTTGTLISKGPCAFGVYRDRTWLSTVQISGSSVSSVVYVSKGLYDPWKPDGAPVSLGTTTTYLGGTVYLQQTLQANSTNPIVTSPNNVTAFPYITAVKLVAGLETSIVLNWNLWPISRLS